ncbi:MAG: peptide chain release factor-like protein [Planctomycetota bacterium]
MVHPHDSDGAYDEQEDPLRRAARAEAERQRAEAARERALRAQGPFPTSREHLESICEISFVRGSGPGGQHRNKVETGVRLVHPPSGLAIVATDDRSQTRNRENAFARLIEKLRDLNQRPVARKQKRVSKHQKKKRVTEKRRQSETKRLRRDPRGE